MLNFDASQTTSFKFWAKGPSDAIVSLVPKTTTISQNEKHFEIVIGASSNRRAWIWRWGPWSQDKSPQAFGNFLNATEYRPFWMSWANHKITFGQGQQIGIDVLSSKDISSYPIETNYLFVKSYGSNTVHFKYGYYDGNFYCRFFW